MANTAAVYARIDTNLKESAEDILAQLGITPSSAIQMLYRQIVLTSICGSVPPPNSSIRMRLRSLQLFIIIFILVR